MEGFLQFGKIVLLTGIGIAIPLLFMWAKGQFVGQKVVRPAVRKIMTTLISLAIGYGALIACLALSRGAGFIDWLQVAVIAGASIAGIVAVKSFPTVLIAEERR
jgi:hypothetical protein